MFSRPAARRTAAALTAALVAVLLVAFGGPTRAHAHRSTVAGASHASSTAKATRVQQAALPISHHHAPLHLDLAATPPSAAADVRTTAALATAHPLAVRTGRGLVTPNGRAPPAL